VLVKRLIAYSNPSTLKPKPPLTLNKVSILPFYEGTAQAPYPFLCGAALQVAHFSREQRTKPRSLFLRMEEKRLIFHCPNTLTGELYLEQATLAIKIKRVCSFETNSLRRQNAPPKFILG